MRMQQRSKAVFKVNDTIDRSFKLLYGQEPKESYNERLKKFAQHVVFGKISPIACYDCDSSDEPDLLEIHHIYDTGERNGNEWREIHGTDLSFYRYVLTPAVPKPELALLCPTCHARRHKSGQNHDYSD